MLWLFLRNKGVATTSYFYLLYLGVTSYRRNRRR